MTTGSSGLSDPHGAMLHRGRMALEALKSREQAARFHAASVDLQIALMEAETGNEEFLKRWLKQYRSLIDQEPELQLHLASIQNKFDFTEAGLCLAADVPPPVLPISVESAFVIEHVSHKPAQVERSKMEASELVAGLPFDMNLVEANVNVSAQNSLSSTQPADVNKHVESPWSAMIAGANRRATMRQDADTSFESDRESDSISSESTELPRAEASLAPVDRPMVIPAFIQDTLVQDIKPQANKKWAWLSSSVMGSMAIHVVALIVMSTYMIHLARNPEPKAIVASASESETISMEAPTEMTTTDDPTLEPSEAPMPTMPTFAAASATSSSDVQLPTSMTGLVTGDTSSPSNDAIQQATNGTSSTSAAANSVQFFGVKAAGNTFCYVVDGSPSMNKDGAFAAAKAELVRSLSLLKPKQRFYVSFFGGEIERLKLDGRDEEAYPVYATPENLQKALLWIDRVRVQKGGLPPNNALLEVIKMDPDGIFLLFDGDTKVDVAEYLRKVNRSDDIITGGTPLVQIHTIGFFTQEFEALMKRIANENRGVYRFVPNPKKPR